MKRCPECRRDYYDDSLLYCLDDGAALLEGPASSDEPATAVLSEVGVPSLGGQRSESRTTDQTAIFSTRAEAQPQEILGGPPERGSFSGNREAEPRNKRNKLLAIFGIAILVLIA